MSLRHAQMVQVVVLSRGSVGPSHSFAFVRCRVSSFKTNQVVGSSGMVLGSWFIHNSLGCVRGGLGWSGDLG